MTVSHQTCPKATEILDALDASLYQAAGLITALRSMADDFGLIANTDESRAYWALLDGVDAALSQGQDCSSALSASIKGEGA